MTRKEIIAHFDEFLYQKFADKYSGLDDNFPDAHSDWLERLEIDEIMEYLADYLIEMSISHQLDKIYKSAIYKEK